MVEVEVRPIVLGDLPAVARIHVEALPDNLYSRLGSDVVRRYFEWQMGHRRVVYGNGAFEQASGSLLGYCLGGILGESAEGFMLSHASLIAKRIALRPWVLSHPFFRHRIKGSVTSLHRRVGKRQPDSGLLPTENPGECYEIFSLAVEPGVQGSGLGKLLMIDQELFAIRLNLAGIHLEAPMSNANAIAFYERIGFAKESDSEGGWAGQMSKSLRP